LSDPAATVLVVEHRDRLTGFGCLAASLAACGRRIVVGAARRCAAPWNRWLV